VKAVSKFAKKALSLSKKPNRRPFEFWARGIKKIHQNRAGFELVFKARQTERIVIHDVWCNVEERRKDKQGGGFIYFHGPYTPGRESTLRRGFSFLEGI
jgi:hypothetical protein